MKFKYFATFLLFLGFNNVQAKNKLEGQLAPQFSGQAVYPDGTVKEFDLQDCKNKKMVLYFYPMDSSPGCTKQAKIFRDEIKRLHDKNIMVVGISYDSIDSHIKFQKKYALPYPLVADDQKKHPISKMYKVTGFFTSERKTFLINEKGIIFKVFDKVDIKHQVNDILDAFAAQK